MIYLIYLSEVCIIYVDFLCITLLFKLGEGGDVLQNNLKPGILKTENLLSTFFFFMPCTSTTDTSIHLHDVLLIARDLVRE